MTSSKLGSEACLAASLFPFMDEYRWAALGEESGALSLKEASEEGLCPGPDMFNGEEGLTTKEKDFDPTEARDMGLIPFPESFLGLNGLGLSLGSSDV